MVKSKLAPERYYGLNLSNMGSKKKNTIEFRMHNGTKEFSTIKENVFFDASLIVTAVEMTRNPEKYQTKLAEFYQTDISEEEKVDGFLNLIMENQEDRDVYKKRWQSVKDAPVFTTEGSKNFAQDRFQREDFKEISDRVPVTRMKKAFNFISQLKEKLNANREDILGDYR